MHKASLPLTNFEKKTPLSPYMNTYNTLKYNNMTHIIFRSNSYLHVHTIQIIQIENNVKMLIIYM